MPQKPARKNGSIRSHKPALSGRTKQQALQARPQRWPSQAKSLMYQTKAAPKPNSKHGSNKVATASLTSQPCQKSRQDWPWPAEWHRTSQDQQRARGGSPQKTAQPCAAATGPSNVYCQKKAQVAAILPLSPEALRETKVASPSPFRRQLGTCTVQRPPCHAVSPKNHAKRTQEVQSALLESNGQQRLEHAAACFAKISCQLRSTFLPQPKASACHSQRRARATAKGEHAPQPKASARHSQSGRAPQQKPARGM